MTRAIAWVLLIVGVGLAAAGGTVLGPEMAATRSVTGPLAAIQRATEALDAAHQAHADAADALRSATPKTQEQAEQAVDARLAEVRAARQAIASLEASGAIDGSPAVTIRNLTVASKRTPPPGRRLVEWFWVGGPWWVAGLVLVVVGALLERRWVSAASRNPSGAGGAVSFVGTIDAIEAALDQMQPTLDTLEMDAPSAELRDELDRIQDELIGPLVDGRMQLAARHGNSAFSVYFTAFSGAERNLARAWSALTDGHSVVARASVARAREGLAEARAAWARVESA